MFQTEYTVEIMSDEVMFYKEVKSKKRVHLASKSLGGQHQSQRLVFLQNSRLMNRDVTMLSLNITWNHNWPSCTSLKPEELPNGYPEIPAGKCRIRLP